jgi:hypothetical protein
MRKHLKKRPTETATGAGLAASIYALLAGAGLGPVAAALIAVAAAFVPSAISTFVDAYRDLQEPVPGQKTRK